MSFFSSHIALAFLTGALTIQIVKYRAKVLLHPSFYFLCVWILSVISYETHLAIGFDYFIIDEKLLNELFCFVSFNAVCFAAIGWRNRLTVKNGLLNVRLYVAHYFFVYYSLIFFLISVIDLFVISGFNVAENRTASIQNQLEVVQSGANPVQLVISLLKLVNLPLIVYGGLRFGYNYFYRGRKRLIYLLPFLSAVLNTVAGGGRSAIATAFLYFSLGMLIALFCERSDYRKQLGSVGMFALVFVGAFILYSTFINIKRSEFGMHSADYEARWRAQEYLAPFSGVLQYLSAHYWGYQLRRTDAFTSELEYGQTTFSCFTKFSVPVISQLAKEPISIQNAFNLKDPTVLKQKITYERMGFENVGLTATVYYVLYDDFGFYGVFVFTFLFVLYTQQIFDGLFLRPYRVTFFSLLPFVVVYFLWTQTIFSHHLSGTWLNGFIYSFLIVEAANYFLRPRLNKQGVAFSSIE